MTAVVVCGCAGALPLAGVALHYLQYCLGLRDLGVEVSYLEEIEGQWPYHPDANQPDEQASYTVPWLRRLFEAFDLPWAYRDPLGRYHGATEKEVLARCANADLLLNVSGAHNQVAHHRSARVLAYIDTDPGFIQVRATREPVVRAWLEGHDLLFTFAEAMGSPSCRIPTAGYAWQTTRQPVYLPFWSAVTDPPGSAYTTVMNWHAYAPVQWEGESWGQKDAEFPVVRSLPARLPGVELQVALGGRGAPREELRAEGWTIADPLEATRTVWRFRDYIAASRAELTIAKQCYVRSRSGWFSERSANYLAAGRPVVAQDTGWSALLSPKRGALPFSTTDEAEAAVREIEADPAGHSRAARELAAAYFDSGLVLGKLLSDAGVD
ncbi:MAG: glycosyltransferase family protein [Mycobacteriales bacterium]